MSIGTDPAHTHLSHLIGYVYVFIVSMYMFQMLFLLGFYTKHTK